MAHNATRTEALGRAVARRLDTAGLTYRTASERTGIPLTTLHRRLHTGAFTLPELLAVADLLGVTADVLIREDAA